MLVTMKSILDDANEHNYGVMAMNCLNIEMFRGAIRAAEKEHSPIIIQVGPNQMRAVAHKEEWFPALKSLAERVKVPVAINHDHGNDLSLIMECIEMGFTNVMYDGSNLSYEENLYNTELVTTLAHSKGVSVEAELGHVGQANNNDDTNIDLYTNPEEALEFIEYTKVDALAVAIGTAHGNYPKGKTPKLDFERLRQLKDTLGLPLVLHGGSGCGEENLKTAIKYGINKINVATDAFNAAKSAINKVLKEDSNADYLKMCMAAEEGVYDFSRNFINIIGSNNRIKYS